jgi:hypothetical protein
VPHSIMTDVGRYAEWIEMCSDYVSEIDTEGGVRLMIGSHATNEEWNARYPDENWALFIRPPRENGVKPVGLTPMFVVLMDPRPRFTAQNLLELRQGTYTEMQALVLAQRVANAALSKQNA